jgi:hypothetical protein
MSRIRSVLLGLQLLALIPTTAPAEEKPRLLVMTLTVEEGVSESAVRLLDDLLMAELQKSGLYHVFGEEDLRDLFGLQAQRQKACDDVSCVTEAGGALGAERAVFGSVGALGGLYVVNLKLVAIQRAVVEARFSGTAEGEESALVELTRRAVAELLTQAQTESDAATAEPQPEEPATTAAEPQPEEPGTTAAELQPEQPATTAAELQPEQPATTTAELRPEPEQTAAAAPQPLAPPTEVEKAREEKPFYTAWWFWGAAAGVVAAAVTVGILATRGDDEPGPAGVTQVYVRVPEP